MEPFTDTRPGKVNYTMSRRTATTGSIKGDIGQFVAMCKMTFAGVVVNNNEMPEGNAYYTLLTSNRIRIFT